MEGITMNKTVKTMSREELENFKKGSMPHMRELNKIYKDCGLPLETRAFVKDGYVDFRLYEVLPNQRAKVICNGEYLSIPFYILLIEPDKALDPERAAKYSKGELAEQVMCVYNRMAIDLLTEGPAELRIQQLRQKFLGNRKDNQNR